MDSSSTSKVKHQASCADDSDTQSLPLDIARANILNAIKPITESVQLDIARALGCVLAEDIHAAANVPNHTNSAMDGYAVRFNDLKEQSPTLKLIGQAFAGHPFEGTVEAGQCVRVMTGGVMPNGSDTVIIQEHVERDGDNIRIGGEHQHGQNIRRAGEDIAAGATVITSGTKLMPMHIGLLASLGISKVKTLRQIKACIFSTGDELRPVGKPLNEGEVYDSNRYMLAAMLKRLGAKITDLGVVEDDEKSLNKAFKKATAGYDVVITSGGVSVGEADFTKKVFTRIGQIHFWKLALKPGRPVAFGKLADAIYFGLPGNPVSVVATFYALVQPALNKMMGLSDIYPLKLYARCASPLRKRCGRTELQRGILTANGEGELTVASTGVQGSGILSSVTAANCFIELPSESGGVETGDVVSVIPFSGLV